jgi:uncharacterized protein YbgA (DUF1722 family)
VSEQERERLASLIHEAYQQGTLEAVYRALQAAEQYLAQYPNDWDIAFAVEPLVLMYDLLEAERQEAL